MQKKYSIPELRLAGPAEAVVLGDLGLGGDFSGEDIFYEGEFLQDNALPAGTE